MGPNCDNLMVRPVGLACVFSRRRRASLRRAGALLLVERCGGSDRLALASLTAALLTLLLTAATVRIQPEELGSSIRFATVQRRDLPLTLIAQGEVQSRNQTEIKCESYTLLLDREVEGTQILYLVPNGKQVQKGELLAVLDSSTIREQLTRYEVALIRARSYQIGANARYENQKSANQTALADAKLQVKLAKLGLAQYQDGSNGQYCVRMLGLDLAIHSAKDKILQALAGLAVERTNRRAIELLYRLGYRRRKDYDNARLRYVRQENALVAAANLLANAVAQRDNFLQYEHKMELARLSAAVASAEYNLERVRRENQSRLVEAEAYKTERDRLYDRYERLVQRYKTWLERCRVYAPHDGIVVYARDWDRRRRRWVTVREGSYVTMGDEILSLPDLTHMELRLSVHETSLHLLREGLKATIHVDATPDRTFHGRIRSIAALPDRISRIESDVRKFETVVAIDEQNPGLRPGMTAVVEIEAGTVPDALSVPIEAAVERGGSYYCLVRQPSGLEQRVVEVGRANERFVQIRSGLVSGEQVVVNPLPILDQIMPERRMLRPDQPSWLASATEAPGPAGLSRRFAAKLPTARRTDRRSSAAAARNLSHLLRLSLLNIGGPGSSRPVRNADESS